MIEAGVVGINLEDYDRERDGFFEADKAVERMQTVLKTAKNMGLPNFVVNARCDVLVQGGKLDAVLVRGKRYLEAGAASVLVWGGSGRGVSRDEIAKMVEAFEGRLNVNIRLSGDTMAVAIEEAAQLGVSRLSIGPQIQFSAMKTLRSTAESGLRQLRNDWIKETNGT